MLLEVPDGPEPVYLRVAAGLRRAINEGEVDAGDRLPTARELADMLGVHHNTVLRAYQRLRDEGVVTLRRRQGAVVQQGAPAAVGVRELAAALVSEARRQGLSVNEVIDMVVAVGR